MIGLVIIMIMVSILLILFIGCQARKYKRYKRWTKKQDRWTPMEWSMVKKLYPVNPDRWHFHRATSCYGADKTKILCYNAFTHNRWSERVYVMLSFLDFVRLQLAYFKYNVSEGMKIKNMERAERNKNLECILKTAQHDIDVLREEANKNIGQASKDYTQIIERMVKK